MINENIKIADEEIIKEKEDINQSYLNRSLMVSEE